MGCKGVWGMNTRGKGNRSRRACIELLQHQGFEVDVVEKTGKWFKVKDMFSLFDLVAVRKSDGSVLFIQVSTNGHHPHKSLAEFKSHFPHLGIRQYVWHDRKGFVLYHYLGLGAWRKEQIGMKKGDKASSDCNVYDI